MALLDFARGPALQGALLICAAATLWRLCGIAFLRHARARARPREGAAPAWVAAVRTAVTRSLPHRELLPRVLYPTLNAYVYHLGLLVVLVGFGPHMLFFRDLTGLGWPTLPSNAVHAVAVLTAAALIAALVRRLWHPVLRLLSGFDDYVSWLVTFTPVATGLALTANVGARYETLLAVHLLSVAAFLVWFPFGKLMHAILFAFSRGTTGALLGPRGARP